MFYQEKRHSDDSLKGNSEEDFLFSEFGVSSKPKEESQWEEDFLFKRTVAWVNEEEVEVEDNSFGIHKEILFSALKRIPCMNTEELPIKKSFVERCNDLIEINSIINHEIIISVNLIKNKIPDLCVKEFEEILWENSNKERKIIFLIKSYKENISKLRDFQRAENALHILTEETRNFIEIVLDKFQSIISC